MVEKQFLILQIQSKSKPCNIPIPIPVYTHPEDYLQRNQETAPKIRQTYEIFFNTFLLLQIVTKQFIF